MFRLRSPFLLLCRFRNSLRAIYRVQVKNVICTLSVCMCQTVGVALNAPRVIMEPRPEKTIVKLVVYIAIGNVRAQHSSRMDSGLVTDLLKNILTRICVNPSLKRWKRRSRSSRLDLRRCGAAAAEYMSCEARLATENTT